MWCLCSSYPAGRIAMADDKINWGEEPEPEKKKGDSVLDDGEDYVHDMSDRGADEMRRLPGAVSGGAKSYSDASHNFDRSLESGVRSLWMDADEKETWRSSLKD